MKLDCLCARRKPSILKLEADTGADPIWCHLCGCNLDLDEVPISDELKMGLSDWVREYGDWIDWETDTMLPDGMTLEKEHNEKGLRLTEKIKEELDGNYRIIFSPSKTTCMDTP
ncbi:hypothetical protein ACQKL0_11015 [Peribacillus sp. NPDC097264]|uniref:hypothetical protein n=1 Tax=Peribacillus sp. NPDC097264 TaxID=3390616 RepID=UPI003CFFA522